MSRPRYTDGRDACSAVRLARSSPMFGATLSLSTETYYMVLRDLVESLVPTGSRRIFSC